MKANKFDNSIKEVLESRTLQPSTDAWTKLSGRLETENKKQNYKVFWWLGVAASLVGLLFVAFQFVNTNEEKPIIVDAPTNIKQTIPVVVTQIEKQKEFLKEEKSFETIQNRSLKDDSIVIISENSAAITSKYVDEKESNQTTISANSIEEKLTLEEQKIQDVVAKVHELKAQHKEVSDDVIDALLREAQKEIRLKQLYNATTGIVDANILLQEVEADLDQSFRSKVFEALKASYNSVKTAVAQRND